LRKKNILIVVVLILIMVTAFLVIKKNDLTEGDKSVVKTTNQVIKRIKVLYDTVPFKSVRVLPILKDGFNRRTFTFTYDWSVNGKKVENTKLMLDKKYINKGDKIYCKITPIKDKKVYASMKTDVLIFPNAPPVIDYSTPPTFDDMGNFVYCIKATDADHDELKYYLVDASDGLTIDEDSGELTWNITKEELMNSPKNEGGQDSDSYESIDAFTIIFKVVDSDGAETKGRVTIDGLSGEEPKG